MCFRFLLAIKDLCRENSVVLCHYIWLKFDIHVLMLMGSDSHLIWEDLKVQILCCRFLPFIQLEIHITRNFVAIENLELLSYAFRVLGGDQCPKVEDFFLDWEDIWIDHSKHLVVWKPRDYNLLLEDYIIIVSNNSWDTALCQNFK